MVVYFGIIALLNLPAVQHGISNLAKNEIEKLLKTEVQIGNIDLGLLNRIIINDLTVWDRNGEEMLSVSRFSAKFDIRALLSGKISIHSVQLFGADIRLYRENKETKPNFSFITELFKKKDKKGKGIDLRINSVLIRRGNMKYDVLSEEETDSVFNPSHLQVSNLSANISLKALTTDSLNMHIKRLSLAEKSGFSLKKLEMKAIGGKKGMRIDGMSLTLPNSLIRIDSILANINVVKGIKDSSSIRYRGDLTADICPSDIRSFVPKLKFFNDHIFINAGFHGRNKTHIVDHIEIYSKNRNIDISVKGEFTERNDSVSPHFIAEIQKADINGDGTRWIFRNLNGNGSIPEIIDGIKYVSLKGSMKGDQHSIENRLSVNSSLGSVKANFTMTNDTSEHRRFYSGYAMSDGLDLGKLLDKEKKFGKAAFNLTLKGLTYRNNKPESYVKGEIKSIEANGYTYSNIQLDGKYSHGGFDGHISMDDKNAMVNIDGNFSTEGKLPVFRLTAKIRNFKPDKLKLSEKFKGTEYGVNLNADFTGKSIDDIQGKIIIDSLRCVAEDDGIDYLLPSFRLVAEDREGKKTVNIASNFLNGEIIGNYSYKTLTSSIIKVAYRYIPSFFNKNNKLVGMETDNNFSFKFRMDNADFLNKVLRLPIEMPMPATLNGYFDDNMTRTYINGSVPELLYKNKKYESVTLLFENQDKELHCNVRTNMMMKKGAMVNMSVNAKANNDSIETKLFWGNNTNVTYSGEVTATTVFSKRNGGLLHTDIRLHPGEVVLNDSVWNIHPSKITIDKDSIEINDFLFEHGKQFVKVDGIIGKAETDSCVADLQNVDLQYVMDVIQFHAVKFEGNTSGKIFASNVFSKPVLDAKLKVNEFKLNEALLGEADIKGGFDNINGRIMLDADIRMDDGVFTKVNGYISPKEKGLDLDIEAGGTDMSFLQFFIKDIFSDVRGKAYGNVRLFGPFKQLDLEGSARAEMGMKVNVLNSRFEARADSVIINQGEFIFNNVKLSDSEGNSGTANGYLRHRKLKDLNYMFRFDTNNMLVFKAEKETADFPFYGNIYASGTTTIRGNDNTGINVDGNVRAEGKTSFVYVLGTANEAISKQFITFVDKTPRRRQQDVHTELYHYLNETNTGDDDQVEHDLRINLQIEPSPQADMKIIMDPASGDYISAKGTGSLRINFFNKGDFQIFGSYNISEGIYKLSMQNIIRKDFVLRPGGSVSFNGDPKAANLNVQAAYTVPSASLNDLIADATSTRGNIRVNCIVNLSGLLTSPNLSFDIELPTVNEEDRQLVKSLTSTPEQMTTQIIYLLGVGKFYTYDYAAQSGQSDATSSLAFSTLSGQLNNMLSQVIDSQNWNVGTNLTTGQNGWTDVEAEAILSGRLLNNRLIINGNFGYKENTLRNTNFVGDFEAIWLLTKNGDFRLRGYNQTNDRYFTKSTLTTQGIGLIYKKDFTGWNELVDWLSNFRIYRKKKNSEKDK